ncbi:MAG TPA: tyrosinase family protein, partial [Chthonomonadales bacterium]|nr:tyrosinase family protein [Chthonomonadales bacterium]
MLGDGIRRNIATVSKEERDRFRDAILTLNQTLFPGNKTDSIPGGVSYWFKQDEIHDATHVHFCPAFLPWHRELMNRFEDMLRQIDPELSLHYWDWTADPQNLTDSDGNPLNLFTPDFMGSAIGPGNNVIEIGAPWNSAGNLFYGGPGPYRDVSGNPADPPQVVNRQVGVNASLIAPADEATLLAAPDFVGFDDEMEGSGVNLHAQGHSYIGGDLLDPHTSFRDPFVFLMHSNIDRLFALWQRQAGHRERLDPNQLYKQQSAGRNGYENTKGGDRTTIDPPGVPDPCDDDVSLCLAPWWGILSPQEPWAGPGATAQTATTGIIKNVKSVRPWVPAFENEQVFKDSRDTSVVIPRSYDTAPHSSYFIVNQDTFSTSQVAEQLTFPGAFYLIYEGFEPQDLGVTTLPPPAAPPNAPTFQFSSGGVALATLSAVNPVMILEAPGSAVNVPQRITIQYDLQFSNASEFPAASGRELVIEMQATLNYNVDTGTGGAVVNVNELSTGALLLVNQPNPYMLKVDPTLSPPNPYWLSMDTRVFKVVTGQSIGVGAGAMTQNDPSATQP